MKFLLLVPNRCGDKIPEAVARFIEVEPIEVNPIADKDALERSHRMFVIDVPRREVKEYVGAVKKFDASIHTLKIDPEEWLKNHGLEVMED